MEYLIMGAQLVLSLSILIVLHEMGHFFPARWFNTRVEKFYLFFDPWFSLFKVKRGDTEYGIGWLPLGGYVKIAGMMDESFDKEQLEQPVQDWEFRAKPAWQRLIIMLGGVTVNFILGFLIWAMVLFVWGKEYLPGGNVEYGIATDSMARELGLMDGDNIISIDGKPIEDFSKIRFNMFIDQSKTVQVNRNGSPVELQLNPEVVSKLGNYSGDFIAPRYPFQVVEIPSGSHNEKSGLKKDDQFLSINGTSTRFAHEVNKVLNKSKNTDIQVGLLRGSDTLTQKLTVNEDGKIGVVYHGANEFLDFEKINYSLLSSIPAGFHDAWNFLGAYTKSLGKLFDGSVKATESLGGFGSIGKMFGGEWIWERFWKMTAILSLILAFMNLLPIPALDGGHVMFLLYEVITGRKPNENFQEKAQIAGFIFVFALVIFANGNDLWKAIRHWFY